MCEFLWFFRLKLWLFRVCGSVLLGFFVIQVFMYLVIFIIVGNCFLVMCCSMGNRVFGIELVLFSGVCRFLGWKCSCLIQWVILGVCLCISLLVVGFWQRCVQSGLIKLKFFIVVWLLSSVGLIVKWVFSLVSSVLQEVFIVGIIFGDVFSKVVVLENGIVSFWLMVNWFFGVLLGVFMVLNCVIVYLLL